MKDKPQLSYEEEQALLAQKQYEEHIREIPEYLVEIEVDWEGVDIKLELRELEE